MIFVARRSKGQLGRRFAGAVACLVAACGGRNERIGDGASTGGFGTGAVTEDAGLGAASHRDGAIGAVTDARSDADASAGPHADASIDVTFGDVDGATDGNGATHRDGATDIEADAGGFSCGTWGSPTTAVSVARGGQIATGYADGDVVVRSATLARLRQWHAHATPVRALAQSDDGSLVASGGDSGDILVFRAADGALVESIPNPDDRPAFWLGFSENGQFLAFNFGSPGAQTLVTVFDLKAHQQAWHQNPESPAPAYTPFFADHGNEIVTQHDTGSNAYRTSDGTVLSGLPGVTGYPSPSGDVLANLETEQLPTGAYSTVFAVYSTSDGQSLSAQQQDGSGGMLVFPVSGEVVLETGWNATTGPTSTWTVPDWTHPLPWSWPETLLSASLWKIVGGPGTNVLAIGTCGRFSLVDGRTGAAVASAPDRGQLDTPGVVRFSPDGSLLAAMGTGRNGGLVVWDATSHAPLWSLDDGWSHDGPALHAIAFSADSQYLYTRTGIYRARDGARQATFDQGNPFCFDHSGSVVFACGTDVPISTYGDNSGARLETIATGFKTTDLAVSPKGTYLAATFFTGSPGAALQLRVYRSLTNPSPLWEADTTDPSPTANLQFSPDGQVLALGKPRTPGLRLFDVATGRQIASLEPTDYVGPIAFSPDGRFLAAANYRGIDIIRLSDQTIVLSLPTGTNVNAGVAFSPVADVLVMGTGPGQLTSFCGVLAEAARAP